MDRQGKSPGKIHQSQTADAVMAGCFLKCSESGYILDLVVQSSARGRLKGQRVADKAKCRSTALGGNLWKAALACSSARWVYDGSLPGGKPHGQLTPAHRPGAFRTRSAGARGYWKAARRLAAKCALGIHAEVPDYTPKAGWQNKRKPYYARLSVW